MRKGRVIFASVATVLATWIAMSAAYASGVTADHVEHLQEMETAEKAGIPQLDPTYYPSQVFWLAIFFVLMYVLMSRVALPRVKRIVEGRDDLVRRDLEMAHRLRAESEDMQTLYVRTLRDADEEGNTHINRLVNDMKTKQEQDLRTTQARLAQKIVDTEKTLSSQKDEMIQSVPAIVQNVSKAILGQLKKA